MIHKSVNEKLLCTMIGILQSAAYVANRLDQPGYARDLIQEEILDFNLADIAGCKKIAKEEGIDLKKVWKERFR